MGIKKRFPATIIFLTLFLSSLSGEGVPLISFVESLGVKLQWEPFRQIGVIRNETDSVVFKESIPGVLHNYSETIPDITITQENGTLIVNKDGENILVGIFKKDSRNSELPRIAAIFIDPGHGGRDPGTIGRHSINNRELIIQEKDVVLSVSLDLYSRLREEYPGKKIILTRDADAYPSLEDRVDLANKVSVAENEAIIFISVHANASLNRSAKGYEVWYLPPEYRRSVINPSTVSSDSKEVLPILNSMLEEEYTVESVLLAKQILKGMTGVLNNETENRGLKEESWFVVRKAKMPSVLIELGFVTNEEEAKLLSDNSYLKKLSEGIYNGITDFVTYFESTKGFTE